MRLSSAPVISSSQIQLRVAELAARISLDYAGRELSLVVVLKGGAIFAADLLRGITIPVTIDFVRARSYQDTESLGFVERTFLPGQSLTGKHVLVVEDILDTGRTASAIVEDIKQDGPASVALCAFLDKPSRRIAPMKAEYVGFEVDERFVIGYGLDFNEYGRELRDIFVLENE